MNLLKKLGFISMGAFGLTNDQWLLIISIVITVLGMIQDYLQDKKR